MSSARGGNNDAIQLQNYVTKAHLDSILLLIVYTSYSPRLVLYRRLPSHAFCNEYEVTIDDHDTTDDT